MTEELKSVTVSYFAVLREHAGKSAEECRTSAATPQQLYRELAARYAFPELATLKVAVNDEFADWQAALSDGDRVVFIPPVAGG